MKTKETQVTAVERFKIALEHKKEVKRRIEERYAREGKKVNVVFQ